ncbi:hypothetical protein RBB75_05955 [Tunturibacter empetritectus]|uniref:Uncharacterized protein n=1 Tax=Tunturiibacter empetritectus TaxID=3069691 RepID=A0AAU7ZGQ8_9BACT
MYSFVPREQIADTLIHLRGLFRNVPPVDEKEYRAQERRELLTKNLLSNLRRTKDHPTLHSVLEVANAFSLTLDGAHRLFGYELERIREYDLRLNAGRTHIIETYPFERDLLVDLPSQLGGDEIFTRSATLHELVPEWQGNVPIHALENADWRQPGAFYVHVGTEDSLGSSLPPGAIALVVPIDEAEQSRPNPRAIYLLQFGNGYRCSRCVVSRGKLILLVSGRRHNGPHEFAFPKDVRIVGRIRMFALSLPLPDYSLLHSLPMSEHNAPLVLPWEHSSMDRLFGTKHRRFRRSRQDLPRIQETMESIFHTKLSGRTERRYRRHTSSMPHVDALIRLSVMHLTRYTDALRVLRPMPSDLGRYSLDALLNARHLADLSGKFRRPHMPVPRDRWMELRKKFAEWPMLLSLRFPQLRSLDDRVVLLPQGSALQGVDPPISPGSLILLEEIPGISEIHSDTTKAGWGRRLYAFRRGTDLRCGYLDRNEDHYTLLVGSDGAGEAISIRQDEIHQLNRISGVAVPL